MRAVETLVLPLFLIPFALADEPPPAPDSEVVVEDSVSKSPDPLKTSSSVTVIEVDERLPAASDLPSVLGSVSGAQVQRLGGLGDWSAVSIRGSAFRQVQVFLDGIPLNPEGTTTVNLSELPLEAFERVEVYRGNAPPAFDASPMGGVVNLISRDDPALSQSAAAAYGSLETHRLFASKALQGAIASTPVDALVFAERFATEGNFTYFDDNATPYSLFDDRLATRVNNDKSQLNVHGRVRFGTPGLRVTLLDAFLDREAGVPGTDVAAASSTRYGVRRNLTVLAFEGFKGSLVADGRAWWNLRQDTYDDRAGEVGTGSQWTRQMRSNLGALTHLAWAHSPSFVPALTLGLRGEQSVGTDLVEDVSADPIRRLTSTGSLSATGYTWSDRLQGTAVVQAMAVDNRALGERLYEDFSIETSGAEQLVIALNPRAGVLVRPVESLALKANAGRYFRPPDFTELFGDQGTIIGNAGLAPEQGFQWDVGGRFALPEGALITGTLDSAYFSNVAQDLIVYVQNTQRTMVPTNLGEAWVHGIEAAATLDWFGWVETQSNVTRNFSVNLSSREAYSGNQLPGIPAWEIYQRAAVHHGDRWRVGYTYSFTDGNYWDETNWYLSAPRPIHGLFARVKSGGRRAVELSVDVLNVTDRIVEVVPRDALNPEDGLAVDPITDFVGYPLPGRTVLAMVRWSG